MRTAKNPNEAHPTLNSIIKVRKRLKAHGTKTIKRPLENATEGDFSPLNKGQGSRSGRQKSLHLQSNRNPKKRGGVNGKIDMNK